MSDAPGRGGPGSPRTYHARIPWQQTTSHPTEAQRYRADTNDRVFPRDLYTMECHKWAKSNHKYILAACYKSASGVSWPLWSPRPCRHFHAAAIRLTITVGPMDCLMTFQFLLNSMSVVIGKSQKPEIVFYVDTGVYLLSHICQRYLLYYHGHQICSIL